jgi:hypothetical protein
MKPNYQKELFVTEGDINSTHSRRLNKDSSKQDISKEERGAMETTTTFSLASTFSLQASNPCFLARPVEVAGLACGSKGIRAVQSRQINASSGPSQRRQSCWPLPNRREPRHFEKGRRETNNGVKTCVPARHTDGGGLIALIQSRE